MTASTVYTAIAGVLLVTAAAGLSWWLRRRARVVPVAADLYRGAAAFAALGAALLACGFGWALYPFDAAHHSWRPVSGVVAVVDYRLLPAGTSFEPTFAEQLRGEPGVVHTVVDDRGGAIRQGDQLELQCVVHPQCRRRGVECLK